MFHTNVADRIKVSIRHAAINASGIARSAGDCVSPMSAGIDRCLPMPQLLNRTD